MGQNIVLIVDDEKSIRDMLGMMFKQAGYAVRSVESAEDAFNKLDRWEKR